MTPYQKVFKELEERKIQYLVAGGFAVNFHQVQRATVDLDLILQLEKANILAFIDIMENLGFSPRLPVNATDFASKETREKWISEKQIMVFSFIKPDNPLETIDIFIREPLPFDELWTRRFEVSAFGLKIKVVSKKDLITLKRQAGREKDEFDIKQLEKQIED